MFVVFLAGGIASGKSSVARMMCELGARRLDLDDLSRELTCPGSDLVGHVARAFGSDVIDSDGALDRVRLAQRAFATPEDAARLEDIMIPAILDRLEQALTFDPCTGADDGVVVVEVPLLDRMGERRGLADRVVLVDAPDDVRRARAIERGMDAADVDARLANQPSRSWLLEHVDDVIANDGTPEELEGRVRTWWHEHVGGGAA